MRCGAGCWRSPPAGEVICLTQYFPAVNAQLKKEKPNNSATGRNVSDLLGARVKEPVFFFVLDFSGLPALPGVISTGWTHRPRLRERLHQFYPLGVNLDEGQQVPGLDRLEQLDHLGRGGRAGLPCVLVVHVLGVYELLPHRPVQESNSASLSEF